MSKFSIYDPEDIENLMINKSFDELYQKEKDFVLRHIQSAEEYEQMRQVLLDIHSSKESDEIIEPPSYMKRQLIEEFEAQKRPNPFILFFQYIQAAFRQPRVQIAFATISVLLFAFIIWQVNQTPDVNNLAYNQDNNDQTTEPFTGTSEDVENIAEESPAEEITVEEQEGERNVSERDVNVEEVEQSNILFAEKDKALEEFNEYPGDGYIDHTTVADIEEEDAFSNPQVNTVQEVQVTGGVNNQQFAYSYNTTTTTKVFEEVTMSDDRKETNTRNWKKNRNNGFFSRSSTGAGVVPAQTQASPQGTNLEENKDVFFGIMYAAM